MAARKATARWQGRLHDGQGQLTAESGTFKDTAYTFGTRFADDRGTNPEELMAAAHAACYAMALSMGLEKLGHVAEDIEASAAVTIEQVDGQFAITKSALTVRVKAGDIKEEAFQEVTEEVKRDCPVSRVYGKGLEVTLDAQLVK